MIDAPNDVAEFLATLPEQAYIADLFTFNLVNGQNLYFTSKRQSITVGGITYQGGQPRITRGVVKLSRGMSIDSHQIQMDEANGTYIAMAKAGFFNLANYTLGRVFATNANSPFTSPWTRFAGQISSVDEIGQSYVKMTAKSMLNLLDNDFPRKVLQIDCNHVLYDAGCKLSRAAFLVPGAVASGSTQNTIYSAVSKPDGYFAQGIISFTSGVLSGISYYVRQNVGGVISLAYPALQSPAVGDTFNISPGCDKTMATCQTKFDNLANFLGTPFIPDPTTLY